MQNKTLNTTLPLRCKRQTENNHLWRAIGLIVVSTGAQAAALNPNQQAVSNALGSSPTCSQPNTDFIATSPLCYSLSESLTPDQIFAMGTMATRVNGGKLGLPWDYNRFKGKNKRVGWGAGDNDFSKLNFWTKADNDFGSRDNTFSQAGFNFDNHDFVFGADYRLRDDWVVGSSFSYRHNNATFDGGRGETESNSYTGNLYTTYSITDALHVEATASYGGYNYKTKRNITLLDFDGLASSSVAKGSPDGDQYAFSWGGGYDFTYQALTVAPYARGEYIHHGVNGYSESGSIAAIQFAKQNIESLTSTVGIQTAYTFGFPWGVVIPQLRGEWHHQYSDGQRQMQASFVNDPTAAFTLSGNGPSRDYYTFGAEASTVLAGGVSAFLAYETLQSYTSINSNKLMLGARLEF
jgi:outer membrane lipase/esterase